MYFGIEVTWRLSWIHPYIKLTIKNTLFQGLNYQNTVLKLDKYQSESETFTFSRIAINWHPLLYCNNEYRCHELTWWISDATEQQLFSAPSMYGFIVIDLRIMYHQFKAGRCPEHSSSFVFLFANVLLDIETSVLSFQKDQVLAWLKNESFK